MMIRYVREENTRQPIGVFVADKVNGKLRWGYSACHLPLDSFKKKKGLELAKIRLELGREYKVPNHMRKPLKVFLEKANRFYFKEENKEQQPTTIVRESSISIS